MESGKGNDDRQAQLQSAALRYADRGWRVFPVKGKAPLTAHGYKDASSDPAVSERMLWADATGVAIATGSASEIVVLDIDPRNGGEQSLNELIAVHGQLPLTAVVRSGSGGTHYYYRIAA